ncbi:hypothetical protein J7L67_05560, partial [bacterium]|nr:hypothetical protein [bacterium]
MYADYEVIPCDKIVLKVLPNGNTFKSWKKNIEYLWNADPLVNDGTVFDGNILMLKEIDQVSLKEINIVCNFTGYKNFYISRKYKNIPCDIQPIGVSGIVLFKDANAKLYTLIGKRSVSVSNYPGYYELLPSGNVDDTYLNDDAGSIDYEKNLITEFQEESGLYPSIIKKISPIGLIHDRKENYYD